MQEVAKSLFERALQASGLVSAAELTELIPSTPYDPRIHGPQTDDQLIKQLLDRGLLNEWQIEQLRVGRTKFTLGPYLIVDAIGKGGMGHVFKAEHELLGRIEAIKVLPQRKSNTHSRANFRHEIRAQADLDHPNLVRVSFAGQDGETHYLVTEYVPGVDLRRLVRRTGSLAPDQAAAIIVQTAEALEYAHRRGLVHRDIKPGNLLVRPDGVVKVTDLGLAWRIEDKVGDAPGGEGKIVGTCDYIPPENIETPDRIIPVSDIYSLGCTLYYAVTGKVPFPGGNAREKIRRHQQDTPISPRAFHPNLDDKFVSIMNQMMHKDPRQRTPSASIAANQLREYIQDDSLEGLARLVKIWEKAGPGSSYEAGDIGETVVSLSDGALPNPSSDDLGITSEEAPSQASQATDPFSEQETEPTAAKKVATAPTVPRELATNEARLVQTTMMIAIGATLLILVAAAVKML